MHTILCITFVFSKIYKHWRYSLGLLVYLLPKLFRITWLSNFSTFSVPDEGYSRNVPDEGYYSNVPDEGYSKNASCALNLISTFLLQRRKLQYWRWTITLIIAWYNFSDGCMCLLYETNRIQWILRNLVPDEDPFWNKVVVGR